MPPRISTFPPTATQHRRPWFLTRSKIRRSIRFLMTNSFIPFHRPSIGREEIEAVTAVLESKWLTTGPVTHAFERAFAEYVGCKHALAVNSCTAALQLALDVIGLQPGD